jgi:hypothetical protein
MLRNPWAVCSSLVNPRRRRAAFNVTSLIGRSFVRNDGNKYLPVPVKDRSILQDGNHLFRKRNKVVIVHLHLLCGNPPLTRVEVELAPLGKPQFSRSDKQIRSQPQRISSAWLSTVAINRAKQLPDATGLRDRRKVLRLCRRQCVAEIGRDVVFGAACRDRVSEYLASALLRSMARLTTSTDFNLAQH